MAYYYDKGQTESQQQFIVENTADVADLPTTSTQGDATNAMGNAYNMVGAGSKALCLEDGKTYVLTTNDEWVPVTQAVSPGGGNSGEDDEMSIKVDAVIDLYINDDYEMPEEEVTAVVRKGTYSDILEKIFNSSTLATENEPPVVFVREIGNYIYEDFSTIGADSGFATVQYNSDEDGVLTLITGHTAYHIFWDENSITAISGQK